MLHIAVCDDEKSTLDEISEILSEYCIRKSVDFRISKYTDGSEISVKTERFDIIFLDIEMEQSNGIEIAQSLRQYDKNVSIIFITHYPDYWQRAFKVHAFGYISKPFATDELYGLMDDYLSMHQPQENETIIFQSENGAVRIETDDICYFIFEEKRKVSLITTSERILIRENMTDIFNRLDQTIFYQTKRNCIVNLNYVQKLQNDFVIVLKDGTLLPLAQKKKDDFMKKLSKKLIKTLKGPKE